MSCCCGVCGPCGSTPCQCGGHEYLGGCGPKPCCRTTKCCSCQPQRGCRKPPLCCVLPPDGFPLPPMGEMGMSNGFGNGNDTGNGNGCRMTYPPCRCETHPCYPCSCRRVPKCAEWPLCPCGRPCYRPLGPTKLCFRNNCCPPLPDCPLPRASPLPCWPRLFKGCKYTPPQICKYYEGTLPLLVRNRCCRPAPACA